LEVFTDFDDIPFTFAPGIRKRFQSPPMHWRLAALQCQNPVAASSEMKKNRAGCWFIAIAAGTLAAAT
jgi:hypothetical protein